MCTVEYKVKVVIKTDRMTNEEKAARIKQFQEAFVDAAVSYLTTMENDVYL